MRAQERAIQSPNSAGVSPKQRKHRYQKSTFSSSKVQPSLMMKQGDGQEGMVLISRALTQKTSAHASLNEDFHSKLSHHLQVQALKKSLDDTDKLIYQEQARRMKIERKLRSAEEENIRLRTLINDLLDVDLPVA